MIDSSEVLIVGAGVVGLACAAALSRRRRVFVIDSHQGPGRETSSRNSGVIHAGLYYPTESLKAKTCVEGRRRLYAYCAARGISHQRTGKLIVAADSSELEKLDALAERGADNQVEGLERLSRAELRRREPSLRALGALQSTQSGVVDVHAFMDALKAEATNQGAAFAFGTELVALDRVRDRWHAETRTAGERDSVEVDVVINAAGLHASRVATMAGLDTDVLGWTIHLWKGDYFALSSDSPKPISPLVYPLPQLGGLGIHLTRDLGGRWIAGPDAAPIATIDYEVDERQRDAFAASVARYLPGLTSEHLSPDYRGIRPKLSASGGFADFVLEERPAGLLHLLGIESPGLTASLALAERARILLDSR